MSDCHCGRIKAVIELDDVPEFQIGEMVRVYFPDSAVMDGTCEQSEEQKLVEPNVSEWLEDSDPGQEYGTTWACRKCMHSIHKPYIWNPYDSGYKYCFNCGARMEAGLNV